MNEIEDKRKELEWDVTHFSGDITEVCSKRDIAENILEGFNLGVEMARKEFLDKIDNVIKHIKQSLSNFQLKGGKK